MLVKSRYMLVGGAWMYSRVRRMEDRGGVGGEVMGRWRFGRKDSRKRIASC